MVEKEKGEEYSLGKLKRLYDYCLGQYSSLGQNLEEGFTGDGLLDRAEQTIQSLEAGEAVPFNKLKSIFLELERESILLAKV